MHTLVRSRASLLALLLATGAVFGLPLTGTGAATGDPTLTQYLEADPIGGSALSDQYLQQLVAAETGPFEADHTAAIGAAEGWANSHTGGAMFVVLVGLGASIPSPRSTARQSAVSGCVGLGGKRSAAHATHVRGTTNDYQVKCAVRSGSKNETVEVVVSSKANVICLIFGQVVPRYSLRKLDAFAIRQFRLLPAAGVLVPAD